MAAKRTPEKGSPAPPSENGSNAGKKRQRTMTVLSCAACGTKSNASAVTWADTCTAKGTGTKLPKGPACKNCDHIYSEGFKHLGTFEQVATMKNEDGSDVADHWARAAAVLGGDTKDFAHTDVISSNGIAIEIEQSLVGLSKPEFKTHFGKLPEEVDLKLRDLPKPNGTMFKGVLMKNPMAPWVTYTVKTTRSASSRTLELDAGRQLFESQAEEISKLKVDELEKDKLVTAMRNCMVTQESIQAKLVEMGVPFYNRPVLGVVGPAAVSAAVAPVAPDASESEGESVSIEEDEEDEGAPSPRAPNAAADARSVAPSGLRGGRGGGAPLGARSVVGTIVGGKPVAPRNESPQDLVARKKASLPIEQMLASKKSYGTQIRFANEAVKSLASLPGSKQELDELKDHIEIAQKAAWFAENCLRSSPWTEILPRAKFMSDNEVVFPSVFKEELHDRKVQEIITSQPFDITECVAVLSVPKDNTTFDPAICAIGGLDGSNLDKAAKLLADFYIVIGKFIEGGADKCTDIIEFAGRVQSTLTADLDNLAEEYDTVASEVEFVSKCLRIMGEGDINCLDSAVELDSLKGKDAKPEHNSSRGFAKIVKKSTFWGKRLRDVMRHKEAIEKHVPNMKAVQKFVYQGAELNDDFFAAVAMQAFDEVTVLKDILNQVPDWLIDTFPERVDDNIKNMHKIWWTSRGQTGASTKELEQWSKVISVAQVCLPKSSSTWAALWTDLKAATERTDKSNAMNKLIAAIEEDMKEDTLTEKDIDEIEQAFDLLMQKSSRGDGSDLPELLDEVSTVALRGTMVHCMKHAVSFESRSDLQVKITSLVCRLSNVFGDLGSKTEGDAKLMTEWTNDLYKKIDEYFKLGNTKEERILHDTEGKIFRVAFQAVERFEELYANTSKNEKQGLVNEALEMQANLLDHKQSVILAAHQPLMTALDSLKRIYKGAADGKSWWEGFNGKTKAALLKHAENTLMEFNGDELKDRCEAVKRHCQHYETILNTFKTKIPDDDNKKVTDAIKISDRTMLEAVCIILLKDETGTEVGRRRKLKPHAAKLGSFQGVQEVLLSVVTAAAGPAPKAAAKAAA